MQENEYIDIRVKYAYISGGKIIIEGDDLSQPMLLRGGDSPFDTEHPVKFVFDELTDRWALRNLTRAIKYRHYEVGCSTWNEVLDNIQNKILNLNTRYLE